ncbi:MAG: YqiA/YcfP family alpha/beta fold hydrolase [Bermanella sp.]
MIPDQLRCLYLHGFKSSPESHKAQLTHAFFAKHDVAQNLHMPQLPPQPAKAIDAAQFLYEQLIDEVGVANVLVIGSSLGGFYASYLVERFGGRAVLINPAVRPYELLKDYLGVNKNYHDDETFVVSEDYISDLRALDVATLRYPQHYLLLLQTHDEVLDYRQAARKYGNGPCIIDEGGDHSYQDYHLRLASIIEFATAAY